MSSTDDPLEFRPSAYMEPIALIQEIVDSHHEKHPEMGLKMGLWLNPFPNLLQIWGQGIEILEIVKALPADEDGNFEPKELIIGPDHPPLRLIRTSRENIAQARKNGHPFTSLLEENLKQDEISVVFPSLNGLTDHEAYLLLFEG